MSVRSHKQKAFCLIFKFRLQIKKKKKNWQKKINEKHHAPKPVEASTQSLRQTTIDCLLIVCCTLHTAQQIIRHKTFPVISLCKFHGQLIDPNTRKEEKCLRLSQILTHSLSPQNSVFPFKPSPEYVSKIISRLSKTNSTHPAIWVLLPEFAFNCTASSIAHSISNSREKQKKKKKKKKSRTSLHKDDPYIYFLRKWRDMSKHSVLEEFLTSGLWSHKWVLKTL